jgi:hypothetical protein
VAAYQRAEGSFAMAPDDAQALLKAASARTIAGIPPAEQAAWTVADERDHQPRRVREQELTMPRAYGEGIHSRQAMTRRDLLGRSGVAPARSPLCSD